MWVGEVLLSTKLMTLARRREWVTTPVRGNQKKPLVQRIRGMNGLVRGPFIIFYRNL